MAAKKITGGKYHAPIVYDNKILTDTQIGRVIYDPFLSRNEFEKLIELPLPNKWNSYVEICIGATIALGLNMSAKFIVSLVTSKIQVDLWEVVAFVLSICSIFICKLLRKQHKAPPNIKRDKIVAKFEKHFEKYQDGN